MRFVKEWYEKETNEWVLQFEAAEAECAQLQKIEAEIGMSFSDMVNSWLRWLTRNPKLAKEKLNEWVEVGKSRH